MTSMIPVCAPLVQNQPGVQFQQRARWYVYTRARHITCLIKFQLNISLDYQSSGVNKSFEELLKVNKCIFYIIIIQDIHIHIVSVLQFNRNALV